jgi:tRNA(Ile)-lysidine synthase
MTQSFEAAMRAFQPRLPLGVAYSGGADSTALLLACARQWPGQVVALHINHGLQAAAADFEAHCQLICAQWGVPLVAEQVHAHPQPGQSPEDAARQARYAALLRLALLHNQPLGAIALAQHADDQVETMLLALSRGSGLAGLSGMAAHWQRSGLDFYRPLLQVPAQSLRQWLHAQGVTWIEDPTNSNPIYTRNRIRANVLPALDATFSAFRSTFARSAVHAAQAQNLLNEVAQSDLESVLQADGQPQIQRLQGLSDARRANVLRFWLKNRYGVIPSEAQLLELQRQIMQCRTRGHKISIKVGNGRVMRQAGGLTWYNPASF